MNVARDTVLELLHSRGEHHEADKAERELPEQVDTDRDAGLLTKFGVHPPDLFAESRSASRGEA